MVEVGTVGVGAVILDGERVLLVKRGQPPSIPLGELTQQFIQVRDQLTTIIDVLPQP